VDERAKNSKYRLLEIHLIIHSPKGFTFMKNLEHIKAAVDALTDKKGENIIALDIEGVSTLTDAIVVAEGAVDRHVNALAHNVRDDLKKKFGLIPHISEGEQTGEWVLLDYVHFIIHIFQPKTRDFYRIEQLYPEAKILEL